MRVIMLCCCILVSSCTAFNSDPFIGKWQFDTSSDPENDLGFAVLFGYMIEIKKEGNEDLYTVTNPENPSKKSLFIRQGDTLKPAYLNLYPSIPAFHFIVFNKHDHRIRNYLKEKNKSLWAGYKLLN